MVMKNNGGGSFCILCVLFKKKKMMNSLFLRVDKIRKNESSQRARKKNHNKISWEACKNLSIFLPSFPINSRN